jgi:hypothetical protein
MHRVTIPRNPRLRRRVQLTKQASGVRAAGQLGADSVSRLESGLFAVRLGVPRLIEESVPALSA